MPSIICRRQFASTIRRFESVPSALAKTITFELKLTSPPIIGFLRM